MRNAALEAKLIRRSIRHDNYAGVLGAQIAQTTASMYRDPRLNPTKSARVWGIVVGVVVVGGFCITCLGL